MSFHDRLIAETSREARAFLAIPLVDDALRNGTSPELYMRFLAEAYHHVKHTFPLLALAASRTEDERYQAALLDYMVEERGHEKWILDDIAAMGGDAGAVRLGQPRTPCRVLVAYAYDAVGRVSPYAMLGSVHVLEGLSVRLADMLADAMQMRLRLSGGAGFSYLRSHGALDQEHVAFFRRLVDGFEDRATQDIIIDHARVFYQLYGDIFRDLGHEAGLSHAA